MMDSDKSPYCIILKENKQCAQNKIVNCGSLIEKLSEKQFNKLLLKNTLKIVKIYKVFDFL